MSKTYKDSREFRYLTNAADEKSRGDALRRIHEVKPHLKATYISTKLRLRKPRYNFTTWLEYTASKDD
jgi:hypothetical protein